MSKVRIQDATLELERDDIGQCQSCRELAIEGEALCWYCKSYAEDIENGIFVDLEDYDD